MRRALALAIIAHVILIGVLGWLLQRMTAGEPAAPAIAVALQSSATQAGADTRESAVNARVPAPVPGKPTTAPPTTPTDTPAAPERGGATTAGATTLSGSTPFTLPVVSPLDALRGEYVRSLVRHLLQRQTPYPPDARQRGVEGTVVVAFHLDAFGNVRAARVRISSGDDDLDAAALAAVHERSPMPAPPAELASEDLEWDWPIPFRLE